MLAPALSGTVRAAIERLPPNRGTGRKVVATFKGVPPGAVKVVVDGGGAEVAGFEDEPSAWPTGSSVAFAPAGEGLPWQCKPVS